VLLAALAAAAVSATLAIAAEEGDRRRVVYVTKPLTTLLILLVAVTLPAAEPRYRALVVAGLAMSLAGDVFLMLPRDRFVPGLVSFLAAHVAYLGAFAAAPAGWKAWMAAGGLAIVGAAMLQALWPGLGRLRGPVVGYVVAILSMAWMAMNRWLVAPGPGPACAAVGALLFVASDSLLALDRFRARYRWSRAWVLATYWVAQGLIAVSVRGG
jgi:uncharacterized membrane protein YhhN